MNIDKTPKTEFGWTRMALYALGTWGIWILCWAITNLVSSAMHYDWIEASFPGIGMALVLGAVFELMRRDKARKQAR